MAGNKQGPIPWLFDVAEKSDFATILLRQLCSHLDTMYFSHIPTRESSEKS